MNTEMTIGKRFMITSGICLILMVVLAGVSISGLHTVGGGVTLLSTNSIPSAYIVGDISTDIARLRGDYWKHMATNSPTALDQVEVEIADDKSKLDKDYKQYLITIDDNDEDRGNYAALGQKIQEFDAEWQKVYPISRAGKTDEAVELFHKAAQVKFHEAEDVTKKMVAYNKRTAASQTSDNIATASHSLWFSVVISIVAVIGGILVAWYMVFNTNSTLREVTSALSEGSSQVVSAATQVSSSSQSLAQGSSEQAAALEETSAAANEINSMAQRNTENSQTTAEMVGRSQQNFGQANIMLDELLIAMDGIDESSKKISKIIKVIDEIAFQTNILALNAAVEAARAGEAGMGFAVVADEVRSLAQRSAQAAKDTAALIEESIHKSDGGKVNVDRVADAIRGLTSESAKMKMLVDEINLGSAEQSRGINQISNSILQMEQVTQSTAASSEESAAAAEELTAQAESMQELVQRINHMVDGADSARHSAFTRSRRSRVATFQAI